MIERVRVEVEYAASPEAGLRVLLENNLPPFMTPHLDDYGALVVDVQEARDGVEEVTQVLCERGIVAYVEPSPI